MKIVEFTSKRDIPAIYECDCGARIFHVYDDGTVKCALCDDYIGLVCHVQEEFDGSS